MRRLVFALFVMFGVLQLAHAQAGVGAKYGARDPVTCKSKQEPAKGAPTPEQVKRYVRCGMEGESGVAPPYLTLLDNVQVEIGKARPFNPKGDFLMTDADADSPVYPIRGSYDSYICRVLDPPFSIYGKNCSVFDLPRATGSCYRTTFGDWNCSMIDASAPVSAKRDNVAPPK